MSLKFNLPTNLDLENEESVQRIILQLQEKARRRTHTAKEEETKIRFDPNQSLYKKTTGERNWGNSQEERKLSLLDSTKGKNTLRNHTKKKKKKKKDLTSREDEDDPVLSNRYGSSSPITITTPTPTSPPPPSSSLFTTNEALLTRIREQHSSQRDRRIPSRSNTPSSDLYVSSSQKYTPSFSSSSFLQRNENETNLVNHQYSTADYGFEIDYDHNNENHNHDDDNDDDDVSDLSEETSFRHMDTIYKKDIHLTNCYDTDWNKTKFINERDGISSNPFYLHYKHEPETEFPESSFILSNEKLEETRKILKEKIKQRQEQQEQQNQHQYQPQQDHHHQRGNDKHIPNSSMDPSSPTPKFPTEYERVEDQRRDNNESYDRLKQKLKTLELYHSKIQISLTKKG